MCGLGLWLTAGLAWGANSCTFTSTAVGFGNYDPLGAVALPGTGTLTFDCTSVWIYVVSLNTGSSGSYAARTLKDGAAAGRHHLRPHSRTAERDRRPLQRYHHGHGDVLGR